MLMDCIRLEVVTIVGPWPPAQGCSCSCNRSTAAAAAAASTGQSGPAQAPVAVSTATIGRLSCLLWALAEWMVLIPAKRLGERLGPPCQRTPFSRQWSLCTSLKMHNTTKYYKLTSSSIKPNTAGILLNYY